MMSQHQYPTERCETCRHYGRTVYPERVPPGQCCERAPDKYQVREKVPYPSPDGKTYLHSFRVIESPFPGVWPNWKCGDYEPAATLAAAATVETTTTDGPAGQQPGTGTKEAA